MAILVTGGAGYIGSHTSIELLKAGYEIVVVDNFSNSRPEVLERIREITRVDFPFYQEDLLDKNALDSIFSENELEAVIHLAGIKENEACSDEQLWQYHQDVIGTVILCEVMEKHQVKKLVFSSSAEVYGQQEKIQINEETVLGATNPYGRTKQLIEAMLHDLYVDDQDWSVAFLRYDQAVGAGKMGCMDGSLDGVSRELLSEMDGVSAEGLPELQVNDFISVVDAAIGHRRALEKVLHGTGVEAYEWSSGIGFSELELLAQKSQ